MGNLDGKVAIVTGGASGIGLATAMRLAAEGASLVIADLDADAGAREAATLGARFVRADVGQPGDWAAVVSEAEESFGGLDLAYLNAGVTTQEADITAVTDEQIRRVFGANVDGVIFGTRAVVPAMERRGGGAIVATASLAGIIAFAPDPLYTATKHAVVGLVRSLAPQLEAKRISINAVCPGIVDTPLVGPAREMLKKAGFPMIPPDDIATAVLHCFSGGAEPGQCLVCQPGRPFEAYDFGEVPGPRTPGDAGRRPSFG
ncbi:MAG: SDR family NAD(P)-dependent oxidoreductase [Actinomycetota bacterium]|nr:SDR family NAD(P)-dependent oxidoreductase [Actinomycetota bacterium]